MFLTNWLVNYTRIEEIASAYVRTTGKINVSLNVGNARQRHTTIKTNNFLVTLPGRTQCGERASCRESLHGSEKKGKEPIRVCLLLSQPPAAAIRRKS
jgi:hypothetical protein